MMVTYDAKFLQSMPNKQRWQLWLIEESSSLCSIIVTYGAKRLQKDRYEWEQRSEVTITYLAPCHEFVKPVWRWTSPYAMNWATGKEMTDNSRKEMNGALADDVALQWDNSDLGYVQITIGWKVKIEKYVMEGNKFYRLLRGKWEGILKPRK